MLQLNKYLRELGIDEHFWLFKETEDKRYEPDEDGFVEAEFFNLDHTLAMILYSYLCYFKEHCNVGHPGYMTMEQWEQCLDDMITAFKLLIKNDDAEYGIIQSKNRNKKIKYGLRQFAKHFSALWW